MSERFPAPIEFNRGEVDSIENKLPYFQQSYPREIENINEATTEGFTYVLKLPRVNEKACLEKYGNFYDKMKSYHDFIKEISLDLTGYKPFHAIDSYYLYKSKADAEQVAQVIISKQEDLDLPIK